LEFFRTWAKRVLTFSTLLKTAFNRWRLVRRGACIADDACIGEGEFSGRAPHLSVGASSFIGRASIMLHEDVNIGAHVCINDRVIILTATHDVGDPQWRHIKKPVIIGDFAWISTGATILPGVEIGRGAVVGAAAVVTKSVPAYGIAVGNPAVLLKKMRTPELRYSPVRFLAFQDAWLGAPISPADAKEL